MQGAVLQRGGIVEHILLERPNTLGQTGLIECFERSVREVYELRKQGLACIALSVSVAP